MKGFTGVAAWFAFFSSEHPRRIHGCPRQAVSPIMCAERSSDAVMNLGNWLRSLGLEKYEAAFREKRPEGNRRWPCWSSPDAPGRYRCSAGRYERQASSADATITSTAPNVSPEDRAERRQVTVMFSDLVGSTTMSARMGPEDLREAPSDSSCDGDALAAVVAKISRAAFRG